MIQKLILCGVFAFALTITIAVHRLPVLCSPCSGIIGNKNPIFKCVPKSGADTMYCRVSKTLDLMDGQFSKAFTFLRDDFVTILKDIPSTLRNSIIEIYDQVQAFAGLIMRELSEVRAMVTKAISSFLAQALKVTKQVVLDTYRVVIKPAILYIQKHMIEPLKVVIQKLVALRVQIRDAIHTMITETGQFTYDSTDMILSSVDQALEAIPESLNVAMEELVSAINQVNQATISSVNSVSGGIYDSTQNSVNTVLVATEAMVSTVTDNTEAMVNDSVGEIEGNINSTIKEINSTIGTMEKLIDAVIGAFNSMVSGWNKARDVKLQQKFGTINVNFGKPLSFLPKLHPIGASAPKRMSESDQHLQFEYPFRLCASAKKGYHFRFPGYAPMRFDSRVEMVIVRIDHKAMVLFEPEVHGHIENNHVIQFNPYDEWVVVATIDQVTGECNVGMIMDADDVMSKSGMGETKLVMLPREYKLHPLISVDKITRQIIFSHGSFHVNAHGSFRAYYDPATNYPMEIDVGLNALEPKERDGLLCYFVDVDNDMYHFGHGPLGAPSTPGCEASERAIAILGSNTIATSMADTSTDGKLLFDYLFPAATFPGGKPQIAACLTALQTEANNLDKAGSACAVVWDLMKVFSIEYLRDAINNRFLYDASRYTEKIRTPYYHQLALLVNFNQKNALKCLTSAPVTDNASSGGGGGGSGKASGHTLPRIADVKIPRVLFPKSSHILPRLDFTEEKQKAQIPPSSASIRAPKIPPDAIQIRDPVMNGIETVVEKIRSIYASLMDPIKDAIASIVALIVQVYQTFRTFLSKYTTLSGLAQLIPANAFDDISDEQLQAAVEAVMTSDDAALQNAKEPDITWSELFRRITSGAFGQIVLAFKEYILPAFQWVVSTVWEQIQALYAAVKPIVVQALQKIGAILKQAFQFVKEQAVVIAKKVAEVSTYAGLHYVQKASDYVFQFIPSSTLRLNLGAFVILFAMIFVVAGPHTDLAIRRFRGLPTIVKTGIWGSVGIAWATVVVVQLIKRERAKKRRVPSNQ